MERILLFLEDPKTRKRLQELLAAPYEVAAAGGAALTQLCDLAIVDLSRLTRMRDPLRARKQVEAPVLFPVLLAALPQELKPAAAELGVTVDEIILWPVEPRELQVRVGNLLQLRRLSRELAARLGEPRRHAAGNLTGFMGVLEDITEKKRMEEQVQRLASFPQMNPNPVLELDLAGRITFHNDATVKTLEKLGLLEITDFLPPDLAEILNAATKGKENYFYREIKLGNALFGQAITYVEPFKVWRIYAMDLTPRLRAEEASRRVTEEWERTFDAVPDLIAILDQNHRVIRCNRAMAGVLGLQPEQLVGRPCYEVLHRLPGAPDLCPHAELLKDGKAHTTELHELGRDLLVTATPLTDALGRIIGSVHVARDITARKRAEEALRRQAELLDLAHDAILVRDLKDRIVFWSRGAEETYGWTREEAAGKECHLLLKTEFPRPLKEIEEELVATGRWEGELVHRTKDGRRLVAASRWALHRGEPDHPARTLQICTDITARKQAEKELQRAHAELERRVEDRTADLKMTVEQLQREVEDRMAAEESLREKTRLLDAFFEHSLTPQVFLDKDFNFIRVNRAYARACQRQAAEFPGRNHFEFYPHEENQAIFAKVVRSKTPYQAVAKPFVFPDHPEWGVTYWDWSLVPILDEQGEVDFLVFSLKEVTERVQAEEARSQLIAILDATPDFVGTADATGQVLYINRAARKILGIGADEDISQVKIGDNHPPWAADLVLHEGVPTAVREGLWQGETVMLSDEGREIPLSQVILSHQGPQGQVDFISTIGRDISDIKRAEEALKESEEKLRFLAAQILRVQEQERRRLSRELHDGLGQALLVFKLQLRAIQQKLPAEYQELRRDANYALQYIDEIIEDIRRLSHNLSPAILEDLGLAAAIKNLCEEFKRLHDLEVLLDLDEVEGLVPRESQINIYRIFQEALANISKYAKAQQVQLAVKKKDGEIAFAIEDDGAGFNVEEVLAQDAADRGLGLAAMDERVRILGGALTVSSQEGEGTRIAFTVPVSRGR